MAMNTVYQRTPDIAISESREMSRGVVQGVVKKSTRQPVFDTPRIQRKTIDVFSQDFNKRISEYQACAIANHFDAPVDVVKLYQVGRGPRAPSVSPFPMKLETFLRMNRIPYVNDHSSQMSFKGKTPWMELNGQVIADSQLCIEYLKNHFKVDPNSHLTKEETAIARGFLKLAEENLYWTMCIEMFGEDLEPVKSVIPYRGFKLWLTVTFLRRVISKETWGHGIGRHSSEDVWDIAVRDMDAISNYLGEKKFFMGDMPSEIDCAIFGMMAQIYWHMPGSKHQVYIKEHLPNIIRYLYRVKDLYWPDWESVTREGSSYKPDHGKIYFGSAMNGHDTTTDGKPSLPSDPLLHDSIGMVPGYKASD